MRADVFALCVALVPFSNAPWQSGHPRVDDSKCLTHTRGIV